MRLMVLIAGLLGCLGPSAIAQSDCRALLDDLRQVFPQVRVDRNPSGCFKAVVLDERGQPLLIPNFQLAPRDPSWRIGNRYIAADGTFCAAVSPGVYSISFSKQGYGSSKDRAFYPEAPQEVSIPNSSACVVLTGRLAKTASLALRGRDAQTGELLQYRLRVGFGRSFDFRFEKDVAQGKPFEIPSQGDVYVKIGSPGYEAAEFRIQAVQPGEAREFEFALFPAVPGCLMGTVADGQGQAVAGAAVSLSPVSSFQDGTGSVSTGEGKFKVSGAGPGVYRVSVAKKSEGYVADWEEMREVRIASSSQCEELNLSLPPKAAWVLVHLVDAKNQLPTSGGVVVTDPETGRRLGRYIRENESVPFPVPPNTPMTMEISAREKREATEHVSIPPVPSGQTIEITLPRP